MGVLSMVVVLGGLMDMVQIASFLDVAPSLVEGVVFGPAKALFKLDQFHDIAFSTPSFKDFLLDAGRAAEFFISWDEIDTHFTQIPSRQPSSLSHVCSREALVAVLRALVVWSSFLGVAQIAFSLDIDPGAVDGIIFGIQLFYIHICRW